MSIFAAIRDLIFGVPAPSEEERRRLKEIALDPDNDAILLEYGRWLSNSGNQWGDFIQVDYELEQLKENDPRREPLDLRWSQLYERHAGRLFKRLRRMGLRPVIGGTFFPLLWMKRGIVREVSIDHEGILPERIDDLLLAAPGLQRIQFHGCRFKPGTREVEHYAPDFGRILSLPQLEQVTEYEFSSLPLDGPGALAIARHKFQANIRVLEIDRLKCSEEDAAQFFSSGNLSELRVLNMHFVDLEEPAFITLLQNARLTKLQKLRVGGENLGSAAFAALAAAANLSGLRELSLASANAGSEGARRLAASENMANIAELNLNKSEIGDEGAAAIASSPHLGKLTKLELESNEIGEAGASALATSSNLQGVTELNLWANPIGDAGAVALANSGRLQSIVELNLGSCNISGQGVAELLKASWMPRLKTLRLSYNSLGEEGARLLAAATNVANLDRLDLSTIGEISDATRTALEDRFESVVSF